MAKKAEKAKKAKKASKSKSTSKSKGAAHADLKSRIVRAIDRELKLGDSRLVGAEGEFTRTGDGDSYRRRDSSP
jgi:hypothetical protein